MFRKLALILIVVAVLGAVGAVVPGLTAGTAMACNDPSCG
ncbi:hypothetical protein I41_26110 [Lacipirellula limnantheis]|uniref:Uncharacterized protein n=1 Tax=Lacipirellula limnantheis TaxID=2528024 RepID=A0A517TYH6_9BACT|nr:hypothetical protein I41_26110 [Lacipirellula limnantheis]